MSSIVVAIYLITICLFRKRINELIVCGPSLFFYFLAYDLRNSVYVLQYFEYIKVHDFSLYLVFGIILVFSFSLGIAISKPSSLFFRRPSYFKVASLYNIKKLKLIFALLTIISFMAFLYNFSNVDFSLTLLFSNPRHYEAVFGASSLINYLYFLNVLAICVGIFLKIHGLKPKYFYPALVILFVISFFHGIKFTILDTFLFSAFFTINIKGYSLLRGQYIFLLTLLLSFFGVFNLNLRGFDSENLVAPIIDYILPNYYNLAYGLVIHPFQFNIIDPFLPDLTPSGLFKSIPSLGFVLNNKYNMPTGFFTVFSIFFGFSALCFYPAFFMLRNSVFKFSLKGDRLFGIFLVAYLDFCMFMMFYFFAFNKFKYIFYIFVLYLLSKYARKHNSFTRQFL